MGSRHVGGSALAMAVAVAAGTSIAVTLAVLERAAVVAALAALAACTREVAVDSPIRWIGRADRVQLRSGERVPVDRVIARSLDSVTIESDGRQRRIAVDDVDAVIDDERVRAMFLGAGIGSVVGGVLGLGFGIHRATRCSGETEDDATGELGCVVDVVVWPIGGLLAGAVIGALPGGAIGATRTHTLVYRRRGPTFTLAPSDGGARAVWALEF